MSFRCILVSFLETFIEISCHFYDFMKYFNVSLHLGLLYWNVIIILEHILVWSFMVQFCGNCSWCGCITRRIWNSEKWCPNNCLICGKCLCKTIGAILWYIVYVGLWVLRWKSLKPSRKTLWCGCMGLVLPLSGHLCHGFQRTLLNLGLLWW